MGQEVSEGGARTGAGPGRRDGGVEGEGASGDGEGGEAGGGEDLGERGEVVDGVASDSAEMTRSARITGEVAVSLMVELATVAPDKGDAAREDSGLNGPLEEVEEVAVRVFSHAGELARGARGLLDRRPCRSASPPCPTCAAA